MIDLFLENVFVRSNVINVREVSTKFWGGGGKRMFNL